MSLLPYLFPEFSRPTLYGQRLGMSPSPEYFPTPRLSAVSAERCPWKRIFDRQTCRAPSAVASDKNAFQVCMDVQQFTPEEITVKTVDRMIVVEAEHEERRDEHGYIKRRFVRKYKLPDGYEPERVVSSLSSDGVLTVAAPGDPIVLPDKDERIVPIVQTGPSHCAVRDHPVAHERSKADVHKKAANKEPEVILAIKYI